MTDLATIQQLSAAGHHQECLQACQKALQANQEETYAYKYAGKSLLALGQLEKAQQCLLKAHQLDGSDPEIVKDIGNLFLNIGNKDTAVGWYEKALEININYAPAINNLANIKRQSGNLQEAIDLFKRAIQANPKLIQAYVGAAASFLALSDLEQAESFSAQALTINDMTPGVNEILGIIYQNKSKPEQAIGCYQRELKVNPQASNSLLNLGLLLLQKEQTLAALKLLEKASALAPSEQCSLLLAQSYQNLGQFKEAIIEYKKIDITQAKNKIIPFNFGICLLNTGNNIDAIEAFKLAVQLDESFLLAWGNIGTAFMNERRYQEALPATQKVLDLDPDNPDAHVNLGGIYKELGQLDQALAATLKSLELKPDHPMAHMNLGQIYKELGQADQALAATLKALERTPDNPDAHMNLGGIYKDLGQLDQALASTLKSLELKPDNPDAHVNLGGIYKDLGQLDQALTAMLKSLKLKPDNPGALNNLKGFIDQLTLNSVNAQSLTKAYELLIDLDNISHNKLSKIFTQAFLPTIQEATKFDPIISVDNNPLANLAADWRLRKSLTLLIPPHQAIEHFLMRLRKELLVLAAKQKPIPKNLKALTEVLATQCFLNEYVYAQSPEEEELVNQLISRARENQNSFNQYLAIIACYTPLHQLDLNKEWLESYPNASHESKALIQSQLEEPREEKRIKSSIQGDWEIANAVSLKVQSMYEANPYPRYRYANFTDKSIAQNISKTIEIESTKRNLQFSEALVANNSRPKVLIAGCGTGNQVITSSRYKNAQITAIDLSSSSLAYAIRKAREYGMDNVVFRKMDLLDIAALDDTFDTIECSGVLHHMEDPAKGLSVLIKQLKPGGYIKLGLYSDIARQDIVKARNRIKQLGLKSTADSIRQFRLQVLGGEFKELENLLSLRRGFYSLSECRDLCFHVQEHLFTTALLRQFLTAEGLIFCGFMVPEAIRTNYQKQFSSDTDMTSLENWGDFEKQNPSTFRSMYQFWACKPS